MHVLAKITPSVLARSCFVLGIASLINYNHAWAQDDVCGPIGDNLCGLLEAARINWNEIVDSPMKLRGFSYEGPYSESSDMQRIIGPSSSNYLAGTREDGQIIRLGTIAELSRKMPELLRISSRYVEQLLPREPKYLARLDWSDGNESFSTTAVLLENYPYVFEPILSSALLREESNTCKYVRIKWIFGITRGEFFVDILPRSTSTGIRCGYAIEGWMAMGDVQYEVGDVRIYNNVCRFDYTYAFATPLVKLTANKEPLGIEVSGIGSVLKGKGECAYP